MTSQRPQRQTLRQIFAWPMMIGVLTTIGLLSALVGDGIWDALSWLTLTIPIVVGGYCLMRPTRNAARLRQRG